VNIQFPRGVNFDEFHYVPSAKQWLALKTNQNWEHPPLAKEIMAVGIGVWGDRPIGWRFMSTVFGSLTLVAMYLWGFALFKNEQSALWVALICLFNQMLYVQSRIGMLDTFMFAFIAWAMFTFTVAWDLNGGEKKRALRYWQLTGVFLGLATACKWFAVMPWAMMIGLVVGAAIFKNWKTKFDNPRPTDWYSPQMLNGITLGDWIICLGVIPIVVYFLTFIPYFFVEGQNMGFLDLFRMQKTMWDGQGRVVNSHPYMSQWPGWALMARPIWYAFDKEGAHQEIVRGVIFLGNPLIIWSGIAAFFVCLWGWLVERRKDAFLVSMAYVTFYLSWAVIPRKVSFYYYYYPAGMSLSLALAYSFERLEAYSKAAFAIWARWVFLGAAAALFIYFFPISAALRIQAGSFVQWMWMSSWI
jgi:dolichyl-phosphate-mannose-protein mannosyltransferase